MAIYFAFTRRTDSVKGSETVISECHGIFALTYICQTPDLYFLPVQQMIEEIWIGSIYGWLFSF